MHTCTQDCVDDLEQHGMLLRIKHEVDPYLEMAEIHRQVFAKQGPAILFEKVKNSPFSAVSNLFGTLKRSEFIFRHSIAHTQQIMEVWANPFNALRNPLKALHLPFTALQSVPLKVSNRRAPVLKNQCRISDLPQIHSWPQDGGAFVTLPQVCTLPPGSRSIFKSNLGMYRVQMSGNQYEQNKEAGLHYQIHRGIGIHHTQAVEKGVPLKVSIFVGGPPSATVAAMMPMPESMSELTFAGMLGGHRFRYTLHEGWVISAHADFCILGTIAPDVKPEGPFGDHLGFHSLAHDFPYIQIEKVLYRDNAIWPFTVVGRPPQEDTSFGQLVHKLTGNIIPTQVPGVQSIHAVDAAGVHSLLLAVGSERYVPYERQKPQEILTQANALLGYNQVSLTKYLWITAPDRVQSPTALNAPHSLPDAGVSKTIPNPTLSASAVPAFFTHVLERVQWERDLHFITATTMDTLDYTSGTINEGSKLIVAAAGAPVRTLCQEVPSVLLDACQHNPQVHSAQLAMPGVVVIGGPKQNIIEAGAAFTPEQGLSAQQLHKSSQEEMQSIVSFLNSLWDTHGPALAQIAWIVIVDDPVFSAGSLDDFIWTTFLKSNPASDTYGVHDFTHNKHWGCKGPLVTDARTKVHHTTTMICPPQVQANAQTILSQFA